MLKALVASLALIGLTTPALADPPPHAPAHGKRAKDARAWDARYPERYYVADSRYQTRRLSSNDTIYRGSDNRYYCRRSDGTTGLIVGALAGGTLGNVIAPNGSKTVGSLIGGSLGAVIGKELDDGIECR
jgi:hypothetical protein